MNQYNKNCFKINSTMLKPFEQSHHRRIFIKLTERGAKFLPEYVNAYFTSEENSYGSYLDWWDGNVFQQRLHWKKNVEVNLKPFEYRYLDEDSKCSQHSNIARFKSIMKDANFSKCPEKCSPFHFLNDVMPSCKLSKGNCAHDVIADYWFNHFKFTHGYKKPCTVLEYQGEILFERDAAERYWTSIQYQFAPPMMTNVQQEYHVFDAIGMIGSVGGTLGMCIGFSFTGVTTFILDFIQARIINYF